MIACIDQIEVSVNERLDHLTTLLLDSEQLTQIVKDEDRKRNTIKNFRIIKSSEKTRILNEQRYLKQMGRVSPFLSKAEVIACEHMLANCINQYLNTDYEVRSSGDCNDLIDIFQFYYQQIKAFVRIHQLTVIRNCQLFSELNFMQQNLSLLLSNMQTSLAHVYENQKNKFFNLTKAECRSLSPEKREEEEEEQFDTTGKQAAKSKHKLQPYCFQLSKLLRLESIYINYFYFSQMEVEKRKRSLMSNFLKRNVHIKRMMNCYEGEYRLFKERGKKCP